MTKYIKFGSILNVFQKIFDDKQCGKAHVYATHVLFGIYGLYVDDVAWRKQKHKMNQLHISEILALRLSIDNSAAGLHWDKHESTFAHRLIENLRL